MAYSMRVPNHPGTGSGVLSIRRDQVHVDDLGNMWTEASDLGLRAGEWPDTISVPASSGGTAMFDRSYIGVVDGEGDLQGFRYVERSQQHIIFVAND